MASAREKKFGKKADELLAVAAVIVSFFRQKILPKMNLYFRSVIWNIRLL